MKSNRCSSLHGDTAERHQCVELLRKFIRMGLMRTGLNHSRLRQFCRTRSQKETHNQLPAATAQTNFCGHDHHQAVP